MSIGQALLLLRELKMEVKCKYHVISGNSRISNAYTCEVTEIVRALPGLEVILFTGAHLPGKTNNDVKFLRINDQPIKFIPRNLHKLFPNLSFLTVARCGIEKLSKEDLIGLEKLEYLNSTGNLLTTLPDNLFEGNKQLRLLTLDSNKLERLSSKLLIPVESTLEHVDFRKNVRIDSYFDRNTDCQDGMAIFKKFIDADCLPPPIEPVAKTAACNCEHEITAKFAEFRASGAFTDFTINVRSKDYKVHKCILAAQSFVFHEMFESGVAKLAKTFTNVERFSEKAFESFLDYFYSGDFDETLALELFELASEFDAQKLKAKCVSRILKNLDESNALEVFNLGHQHRLDQLKQPAFKTIQAMFPDLKDNAEHNVDKVNKLVALKRQMENLMTE